MNKLICIGKIVNTHAIKGEVRILSNSYTAEDFKENISTLIVDDIELEIESVRKHKKFILAKFKGLNSINDVLKYKGSDIYINESEKKELSDNEYFISDIIGMEVYDENEEKIGTIKEVMKTGSNDVYVVDSLKYNKEILIPAIKSCIKNIDFKQNKMKIILLDGLV